MSQKSAVTFADPTPEQMAANLAAAEAVIAAAGKTRTRTPASDDLTAGRPSAERVFYYATEALSAGADRDAVIKIYTDNAEQLQRNPNTKSKAVCLLLRDLADAARTHTGETETDES